MVRRLVGTALLASLLIAPVVGAPAFADGSGPPVTLSGVIRDQRGNPAEDVQLDLTGTGATGGDQTTSTASDGSYSFVVSPGDYAFNLGLASPGYQDLSLDQQAFTVTDNTTEVQDDGTIVRSGWIEVSASDQFGAPTAQFSIDVRRNGEQEGLSSGIVHGNVARWTDLATGSYTVGLNSLVPVGRQIGARTVTVADGDVTRLEVVVPQYVPVQGRVVDADGSPIVGAVVAGPSGHCVDAATTGADGTFTLECHTLRGLVVHDPSGQYADRSLGGTDVSPDGVDLGDVVLSLAGHLTATVTDAHGRTLPGGTALQLLRRGEDGRFHPAAGVRATRLHGRTIRYDGLAAGVYKARAYQVPGHPRPSPYQFRYYRDALTRAGADTFRVRRGAVTVLPTIRLPHNIPTLLGTGVGEEVGGHDAQILVQVLVPRGRPTPTGSLQVTWNRRNGVAHTFTRHLTKARHGRVHFTLHDLASGRYRVQVAFTGSARFRDIAGVFGFGVG